MFKIAHATPIVLKSALYLYSQVITGWQFVHFSYPFIEIVRVKTEQNSSLLHYKLILGNQIKITLKVLYVKTVLSILIFETQIEAIFVAYIIKG